MANRECDIQMQLGDVCIAHRALVAPITDNVILGLDFMEEHNIKLDMGSSTMCIGGQEIVMTSFRNDPAACRVVVVEDNVLTPHAKSMVYAEVVGVDDGLVGVVDPNNPELTQKAILTGRTLVKTGAKMPVRIVNLKDFEQKITKGTVLGMFEAVTLIRSCEIEETQEARGSRQLPTALRELVERSSSHLEAEQVEQLEKLLAEFTHVFALSESDSGRTNLAYHRIDTGSTRPIKQASRRVPRTKQEEVNTLIRSMEEQGVIEPSQSPWASPIVLVRKKDGSTRFCVDNRKLNDVTQKDSYPLPRIDDTLDSLSGARWFSTLGLKSGYWQVALHPEDKEKTAFTAGNGLWHFNVMPFGLCNAPATFERLMDTVLRGLNWKICLVYLDDVIILGKSFEEHLANVREVFKKLNGAKLKLSPKKCNLFCSEVKYLGHVISAEDVSTDPEKTAAVHNWSVPKDQHQLRSFLGLCSYHRRFIGGFADIARPLHKLTEDGVSFQWTEICQRSFETLNERLTSAPILAYPQFDKPFIVDIDASNEGIGGVLSQEQDGQEKVIAYVE